ncbi:hypothetical protein HanHA89_Chr16g0685461 [Helianthus annuus]|nr:hypothetical protein HanHA89_Chr16g0685461 [Helianthus annuus]
MASPTTTVLFSLIVAISAISATARPCKTIFFITSTYLPTNPQFQNPNPNPNPNSPRLTFFITEIHQFHRTRSSFSSHHDVVSSKPYFPPSNSSIRDRTMDIMSIVGALLFGVGCGALTAGTMYLIWALFSNRCLDIDSDDSDCEVEDDVSPSKNGYVAVPTVGKEVPPSADEVDAMK